MCSHFGLDLIRDCSLELYMGCIHHGKENHVFSYENNGNLLPLESDFIHVTKKTSTYLKLEKETDSNEI